MPKRTRVAAPAATSPWTKRVAIPATQALARNETADVCIVGAGIAGLTTAHLLAEAGQSVVVIDDGPIGRGMTSATSAHLSNAIDAGYTEIEQMHGERGAQIVVRVTAPPSIGLRPLSTSSESRVTSSASTATSIAGTATRISKQS
jgi:thioredoxin reductase